LAREAHYALQNRTGGHFISPNSPRIASGFFSIKMTPKNHSDKRKTGRSKQKEATRRTGARRFLFGVMSRWIRDNSWLRVIRLSSEYVNKVHKRFQGQVSTSSQLRSGPGETAWPAFLALSAPLL
jgi:hypothetical protein